MSLQALVSDPEFQNDAKIYSGTVLHQMYSHEGGLRTIERAKKQVIEDTPVDYIPGIGRMVNIDPPGWVTIVEPDRDECTDYPEPQSRLSIPKGLTTEVLPLQLNGDYGLISDFHVPYHDATLIEKFLDTCQRLDITKAIIVGDFMDANQFSKRGQVLRHQRKWQEDVEVGEAILRVFSSVFDEVVFLMGNHDEWYEDHYRGLVDAEWLLPRMFQASPNIKFSRYEQADVTSGGKVFKVTHGANYYGTNPLSLPQKLSAKYGCGIVTGHQHLAASGWDYSGKHQCVCLGCAANPESLVYLHKSPKTMPQQTQGYAILKEGYAQSY